MHRLQLTTTKTKTTIRSFIIFLSLIYIVYAINFVIAMARRVQGVSNYGSLASRIGSLVVKCGMVLIDLFFTGIVIYAKRPTISRSTYNGNIVDTFVIFRTSLVFIIFSLFIVVTNKR